MKRSTLPSRRSTPCISKSLRCLLQVEHLEHRWCPAVPAFSSLPGVNHTIYLDFDGHVTQNTQWNSYFNASTINSPAYSTDSDFSNFSASELAEIEQIWNRVAEDFIPFQVNVTTVDPGIEALRKTASNDSQWGIRVIMTSDTQGTGAGGIAYGNSFNWNVDTGVFVYVKGGKNAAEAASHEVGHSLGLSHDGTTSTAYYTGHGSGSTSWAPLMGAGYYSNVTAWDRGEFYAATNRGTGANYGNGENDLTVITTLNGFSYRPDDVGNTQSSASPLTVSGTSLSGAGIITTTTDVDYFSFTTGAGLVSLNISPFAIGPNLDVKADLFDASGNLVASSNSSTSLNATFSLNLNAGQYFVRIDGTGFGSPGNSPPTGFTEYASLGRYTISGTIVDTPQLAQFTINDVSVNESAGTATFTVSLTGSITSNATVNFATANGTAAAPGDYTATTGTLTFTPGGSTTQTVTVSIVNDSTTEPNETFTLNLSSASNAVIADGQGVATIVDNDVTPTLTIAAADANKAEGTNSTATPFTFTITRTGGSTGTSTVNWVVTGTGTAASANDFSGNVFPTGSVTFASGETSKTVTINVLGDSAKEKNEKFRVTLSNPSGAVLGTTTAADGTIVNDDGSGGKPGRALLPHLFPLPGQEHLPQYQHDHDDHEHEHKSPALLKAMKQQAVQALYARFLNRLDTTAFSQVPPASTNFRLNAPSQMPPALQKAASRLPAATLEALINGTSRTKAVVEKATTLVDQLFSTLNTKNQ